MWFGAFLVVLGMVMVSPLGKTKERPNRVDFSKKRDFDTANMKYSYSLMSYAAGIIGIVVGVAVLLAAA